MWRNEVSIEKEKTWAENGNKTKDESQFSAEADSSKCNAEWGFKQKRFSERDRLHIQNLATVFLNFKKIFGEDY